MALMTGRRSRALDSDDNDDSRPNTPSSTAPNDSKRMRRPPGSQDDVGGASADTDSAPPSLILSGAPDSAVVQSNVQNEPKYQPGAIVRVKLTNFVTYTSAEFFPGPNLNMVIGPNGTGKSTLVCAICLGLGWPPSYLGRAKDPSEFVKHGCREATIEIELHGPPRTRRNPIIMRTIKKEGNKSVFMLNDKASSAKMVQAMANSFNIQIDNLCQFLPQDKVVEFAQMSPVELLASTQRAVAGAEMTKMHEDLKKLRSSQTQYISENRGHQEQLVNLQNRQEMQRSEVDRMRERASVQKRLTWFEKCRPIARYADAKTKYRDARHMIPPLDRQLTRLKDASAPTLKRLESKQRYSEQAKQVVSHRARTLKDSERECDRLMKEVEEKQDRIKDLDNKVEAEKKSIPNTRGEIKQNELKLTELKRKKAEPPEDFDVRIISDEIQSLRNKERQFSGYEQDLKLRYDNLREQGKERTTKLTDLNNTLQGLETQAGQQENKLNSLSRDTFQAWKWVQENRDQFKDVVYGPPILECSLQDSRMADAIESLLQENDFKIITAQNREDFLKLQQKLLKEKKLHDVSLRTCSASDLSQHRPPLSQTEMNNFGLDSWAIDHLVGPPTVLAMLCSEKALHRSAIASKELSQQQHDDLANTTVQSYVAGRKTYQFIRRAEYGSAGNTARVRDVRPAQRWTDQPVDMGRKASIERSIAENHGELEIIRSEILNLKNEAKEKKGEHEQVGVQLAALLSQRDAKQTARKVWLGLDQKIQDTETKLEGLQDQIEGFRGRVNALRAEKDHMLLEKAQAILDFAAATGALKAAAARFLEAQVIAIEAASDVEGLEIQNEHIVQTIQEKEVELAEARRVCAQEKQVAEQILREVYQLKVEAQRLEEEEEDSGLAKTMEQVGALQTEENLDAEIDSQNAQLALTEGGNASIIKEFEDRAKIIEKLKAKVQEAERRQEAFANGIKEIRGKWEPKLEGYVERISAAFSDSFDRIGCAGQVTVFKASSDDATDCTEENGGMSNGLDFGNWAIHISVKFREQEPLSLLDSHRQSGGERAVSTIFYLMALQSLSQAPFRVVDEINQGMDPRNERMVHGRMVDIAAEDGGSQYFLITPKLLNGLKYRRGMTVLCIVSGENMPAARQEDGRGNVVSSGPKIDFRAFAKRARELGIASGHDARSALAMNDRSFTVTSQVSEIGAF
ncbi:uncharacterized protein A1O9_12139 [Exophiala aquamarina CBS 119918]|uniref:Structural maintenance of chromosomes protein 5 n=1 Tax=Exophiala aquamarina CBS 119918 TaxID=1182545 RepID=A0A072NWL8_9EURO|nr:uncharacterized protein A1O9_12139 [Exophiala aquamarina CBS 119918]KEF51802.1 hypothetical protein A1O9_12139 [Exophiala aquamarina CBS 119918]